MIHTECNMEASLKRKIVDETTAALASTATTASKKLSNGYVIIRDDDGDSLLRRLLDTDPNQLALTAALRDDDGKLLADFSIFCNSLRSSIDKQAILSLKWKQRMTKNIKNLKPSSILRNVSNARRKTKLFQNAADFVWIRDPYAARCTTSSSAGSCAMTVWTRKILVLCTARSALNFYVTTLATIPATDALYAKKMLVSAVPKIDLLKILEILMIN